MSGTDARAPLSVVTEDLTLTVDGVDLDVRSTGERLFVEVPTVRDAIRVVRRLPENGDARAPAALLTATRLTTEVRVRGRTVAVIGADARPGRLSRELGVAPAEVRVAGALGAGASGLSAIASEPRRLFA
ncbi:peptide ABC transporter ATP-binding protein [Halorubrum sp. Ib24]|uniref:peptide ABC transporter ATP-binding protein n=1 Tax=unclassified Halorubrum TaxID=2642239 RepID=UPI000B97EC24|nr:MULTISPECIES: peptide ABC transporter ATP-binding protein [unclassified Halorubrum]OYR39675.1 peptide ABC transporter ATP-binding protein [Halorubrum sp. Ib24]OYR46554.1 peptide ABC transporter ATP-binding protein [Halorubrum sp. Ea8]OYR47185.1 peptide ABC transporter ATP-binding protein [Halorubrum sp. Eb13]OYR55145.1 peptide ABC transporter ATP-binding protein [Halorubrum sp. Ea1]